MGATKRGKGTKWMVVVDGAGVPLGSQLTMASPAKVKLVEAILNTIAGAAHGWGRRGLLLTAPHRKKPPPT